MLLEMILFLLFQRLENNNTVVLRSELFAPNKEDIDNTTAKLCFATVILVADVAALMNGQRKPR